MGLNEIWLENYKAFRTRVTVEVRPLTVLIGRNSSGKSVIARLPLLIGHSLSGFAEAPLDLEFNGMDFGALYTDLIHNQVPHGAFEIGARLTSRDGREFEFSAKLQHYAEYRLLIVSQFKLREIGGDTFTLTWTGADALQDNHEYRVEETGQPCRVSFNGLFPSPSDLDEIRGERRGEREDMPVWLEYARKAFSEQLYPITYLGPFRESPSRQYRMPGGLPRGVGFAGARAPELLVDDSRRRSGDVLRRVGDWFAEHFGGWRLDLSEHGDAFSVVLRNPDEPSVEVNLADVGTGIAQVLPIVVQRQFESVGNRRGSLEIVEQPELHLHPAAHGDLADLYALAVKQSDSRFIIETHSENFLLRLRRRIAEGELDPEKLIIYWVDDEGDSARRLRRIQVDENGEVDHWPSGVFAEDFREVGGIRNAQRKRCQ